jgi:GTP pyrophosphokinase
MSSTITSKLHKDLQSKIIYLNKTEQEKINKAYEFAKIAHQGQLRLSKEPYINHLLSTAIILTDLKADVDSIVAGILHDTLEDTKVTETELKKEFGDEILQLVDGVTKVSHVRLNKISNPEKSQEELRQLESLRKLFIAMAKDLRVVLIKLADRLHNIRTLQYVEPHKQARIASETLEIYVPLANRLGLWPIKSELEDLCFKYLYPAEYTTLLDDLHRKTSKGKKYIDKIINNIKKYLAKQNITNFRISGRMKNIYSIYQKTIQKNKTVDEIYDIYAVRILTDNLQDCYSILGYIHNFAKPIPGRFKDYIGVPKPNGYQSLHTSVFTGDGQKVEIQIRTFQMHESAEYGIAAHWLYKEKKSSENTNWVKELSDLKNTDLSDLTSELKIDIFQDRIFIYTPKGDVKDMPLGSTPIDFAYHVHSHVGDSLIGAKVNGKIVPIDYVLQNSDIVDILTSKVSSGPKRQWLDIAKTNFAKSKIKSALKKVNYEQNLKTGQEELNKELTKLNLSSIANTDASKIKLLLEKLPYKKLDDIIVGISQGDISPRKLIKLLYPLNEIFTQDKKSKPKIAKTKTTVYFGNNQILAHKLAGKCCQPKYPNPIIGYITRGQGITVHNLSCKSLNSKEPERLIVAKWNQSKEFKYYATIKVVVEDRVGMLHDITQVISDANINLSNISVEPNTKPNIVNIAFTINIDTFDHLSDLINKLSLLPGVIEVFKK